MSFYRGCHSRVAQLGGRPMSFIERYLLKLLFYLSARTYKERAVANGSECDLPGGHESETVEDVRHEVQGLLQVSCYETPTCCDYMSNLLIKGASTLTLCSVCTGVRVYVWYVIQCDFRSHLSV